MHAVTDQQGWIIRLVPELVPPGLKDNTAHTERLMKGIKKFVGDGEVILKLPLIRRLPVLLRETHDNVQVVLWEREGRWHVIDLFPVAHRHRLCGLAVDLGTTTVVLRLLDLETAAMIDEISFVNPQIDAGEDILSRIHFASQAGGLDALKSLMLGKINEVVLSIARKHGIGTESLVGMSVAGNTTMTHLFLGLDPGGIIREPYIPVVNKPGIIKAADAM